MNPRISLAIYLLIKKYIRGVKKRSKEKMIRKNKGKKKPFKINVKKEMFEKLKQWEGIGKRININFFKKENEDIFMMIKDSLVKARKGKIKKRSINFKQKIREEVENRELNNLFK